MEKIIEYSTLANKDHATPLEYRLLKINVLKIGYDKIYSSM